VPQAAASRLIGDLAYPEVAGRLKEASILCLPLGSIEQHGPHLPLNTDVVLAEELTKRIVARWGEALDLWQLPTIPLGLAREHEWASGTVSLSIGTLTGLLRDLGHAIVRGLPARNLAIINGHGGNSGILQALLLDLRADFGLNTCVMHPAGMLEADAGAAIPDIHAGKDETSMMLAVAPHLVRQDRIAQLKSPPSAETVAKKVLPRGVIWPWTTDDARIADMGVIGDAKAASAQHGQEIVDRIVDMAGPVLEELLENQKLLRHSK
jgi:creatinine amidohydrolase/Fe(II)-dependent formamide hydrolase-like protein